MCASRRRFAPSVSHRASGVIARRLRIGPLRVPLALLAVEAWRLPASRSRGPPGSLVVPPRFPPFPPRASPPCGVEHRAKRPALAATLKSYKEQQQKQEQQTRRFAPPHMLHGRFARSGALCRTVVKGAPLSLRVASPLRYASPLTHRAHGFHERANSLLLTPALGAVRQLVAFKLWFQCPVSWASVGAAATSAAWAASWVGRLLSGRPASPRLSCAGLRPALYHIAPK